MQIVRPLMDRMLPFSSRTRSMVPVRMDHGCGHKACLHAAGLPEGKSSKVCPKFRSPWRCDDQSIFAINDFKI
jgi:hypothetical protein